MAVGVKKGLTTMAWHSTMSFLVLKMRDVNITVLYLLLVTESWTWSCSNPRFFISSVT